MYCNVCGASIKKLDRGFFEDHLEVEKTWGYGVPIDGEKHAFDICYACYENLLARFSISV